MNRLRIAMVKPNKRARIRAALTAAVFALPPIAHAARPDWPDTPYAYTVVDQDLRAVLQEFGTNLRLSVRISDEVHGRVRGKLPPLAPAAFLDRLAASYGLVWFWDGAVLDVSTEKELASRILPLGGLTCDRLGRDMASLDLADSRFPLRCSADAALVSVSGPPRFVALVQEILSQAHRDRAGADPQPSPSQPAEAAGPAGAIQAGVRIFRGHRLEVT